MLSAKANEPNKPLKVSRMQWASAVSECGMTVGTQMALAICLWDFKPGNQEHIDTPIKCSKKCKIISHLFLGSATDLQWYTGTDSLCPGIKKI